MEITLEETKNKQNMHILSVFLQHIVKAEPPHNYRTFVKLLKSNV